MDLQKAREKFAEINLKHGFYTQKELKFTDFGVFECTAAEQDFDMWWECLIYYAQPLIDQKEKALLEQFEINNKLVEQVEKLKAQAVPEGFVLVEKELPESIAETMALERVNKPFGETDPVWVEITEKVYKEHLVSKKWELRRDYKAMIEAQEPSHD